MIDVRQDPDGDSTAFAYHLRFPGQYFDAETGLSYNYFRDYDPAIGRYVESDPIGLEGGINTYGYAYDDPVGLIDPSGLEPKTRGRGERGQTRSPSGTQNPFKHYRPHPTDPGKVIFKDPHTGKDVVKPKPPGYEPKSKPPAPKKPPGGGVIRLPLIMLYPCLLDPTLPGCELEPQACSA